ncbi:type VII toxin-antitoxin system MntA family adenylyltransferase antitoxin [Vibrio mexicanus]|uniref:type VII toxin-antitoxin system MntA family adenylyltransferase antitoxin n=1 Tax=Vibrio mexicanus TaxID=1004326 RepID=UPI00069A282B|nr:nucleotidyltransferase domain-containing protein [Vibrio mexicanus]
MKPEVIVQALNEVVGTENIVISYLFGSFATGRNHQNSDIDIAFLPTIPMSDIQIWDFKQSLSQHLQHEVDLVNLMTCNTVLRMQIATEGKKLLGNGFDFDKFEVETYRMYQDLQMSRAGNIESFKSRWQSNPESKL